MRSQNEAVQRHVCACLGANQGGKGANFENKALNTLFQVKFGLACTGHVGPLATRITEGALLKPSGSAPFRFVHIVNLQAP
jgi:hypothetical protein